MNPQSAALQRLPITAQRPINAWLTIGLVNEFATRRLCICQKAPSPMKAGPGQRAVDPLLRKDNTCDVESGRLGLAQREFLLLRHWRPEEMGDPHAGDAREEQQRAARRVSRTGGVA